MASTSEKTRECLRRGSLRCDGTVAENAPFFVALHRRARCAAMRGAKDPPPSRAAPAPVVVNGSIAPQPGRLLVLKPTLSPGRRDCPVGQDVFVTWRAAAQEGFEHCVVSCLLQRKLRPQPREGMLDAVRSRERVVEPGHPTLHVRLGRLQINKFCEAPQIVVLHACITVPFPVVLQVHADGRRGASHGPIGIWGDAFSVR